MIMPQLFWIQKKNQLELGDDKGAKAEVLQVMPKKNKVIVKGCKIAKKAVKPTEDNPKGGFLTKEMPIDSSNVRKVEA